ncbi:hypothetical protein [Streptomyces vinaceus]|uniref:hypothetical protein n=1 Tax=Streptomyces vinaceus TaxID=1960 RepID=UPI00105371AA|nr:hypothetical protein [Streptomyces vinaceus]GHE42529.1 hypothetical protein GCM10017778_27400 [Streptomyces vinaceus]
MRALNRGLSWWPGRLCLAVVTGCVVTGCTAGPDEPASPPAPRTSTTTTAPRPKPTDDAARDVLLAQQFDLGGDAASPFGCREDLALISRDRPAHRPMVWVTSAHEARPADAVRVVPGEESVLCLLGFPNDKPITVTVTAGGRTYVTSVQPVVELGEEPDGDLFDGRPIEVQDLGDGVLQSGYFSFLPSDPAREPLARDGRLDLSARSGALRTGNGVPVRWEKRGAATEPNWEHSHRIAVYGYLAGTHVPIGLYRVHAGQEVGGHAVLERRVGEVVVPASRIATFTVPGELLSSIGAAPPTGQDYTCLSVPDAKECIS